MYKLGLFHTYKGEKKHALQKILCFKNKSKIIDGRTIHDYSSLISLHFNLDDHYVVLAARPGEVEIMIREFLMKPEKTLVYSYLDNEGYISSLKEKYKGIKIINAHKDRKVILQISDKGFEWKDYDHISLPKQNNDKKGDEPTAG